MQHVRAFALASLVVLAACGHKPPYGVGQQPQADTLLQQTEPQLPAIAVADAQITLDRVARADLQMLAQVDSRFRASVTKAGNELVTLAFTEESYAMRYKLDQLPTGFYSGPADPCAVEWMLGVPLSYDGLVALVLGGAPLVEGAVVTKQKWDRKLGYETLTLTGGGFTQELWFAWMGGAWVFSGGKMWKGDGKARADWMWTLEHDRHETIAGVVLPGRTRIRAPGKKRDHLIVLAYKERVANPPWSRSTAADPSGGDDGGADDGGDEGGWENADDGGWENEDDGGWEDEEPATPAEEPANPAEEPADAEPVPEASPAPPSGALAAVLEATDPSGSGPAASPIPAVFTITASGLPDRGDLCR